MTLVVARVTPLGVRVAGDMRITNPNATESGFLHAELKVILLSPTLCVAYAGNVGAALSAIRQVPSQGLDAEETQLHLLGVHERSKPKADFLVASLRPSKLVVIKDGRAEARTSGWLGDADAFSEYQRTYHDPDHFLPPPEFYESEDSAKDLEVASRMSTGMHAVVDGASVFTEGKTRRVVIPRGGAYATVGEAIVIAQPRVDDNLFAYSIQSRATAPVFADPPLPAQGGVVDPGFGSAELGAFSYFLMAPEQPGVGVIGAYFHEGRLGLLYAPLVLDVPERYPRVSQDEFVELVRLRRGISPQGFGFAAR